jgi:hypothetical protein
MQNLFEIKKRYGGDEVNQELINRFDTRDDLIKAYKKTFESVLGELVLEDIIDICMCFANPLTGGDAENYSNIGKQQIGNYILSILNSETQEANK